MLAPYVHVHVVRRLANNERGPTHTYLSHFAPPFPARNSNGAYCLLTFLDRAHPPPFYIMSVDGDSVQAGWHEFLLRGRYIDPRKLVSHLEKNFETQYRLSVSATMGPASFFIESIWMHSLTIIDGADAKRFLHHPYSDASHHRTFLGCHNESMLT